MLELDDHNLLLVDALTRMLVRLHRLRALGHRGTLHERASVVLREQVLCHVLHCLLVLTDVLVDVLDLVRLRIVAATHLVLLYLLHFNGPSLVLLS